LKNEKEKAAVQLQANEMINIINIETFFNSDNFKKYYNCGHDHAYGYDHGYDKNKGGGLGYANAYGYRDGSGNSHFYCEN